MAVSPPVIVWFRRDLRLADNDALHAAHASGAPVIPVFVLDRHAERPPGAAGLWWLDKSLIALGEALERAGSPLILREGATVKTLLALAKETGADRLVFGKLHGPGERAIEVELGKAAGLAGVSVESFRSGLMSEPGEVLNGSGEGYKVFTPYLRALRAALGDVRITPGVRSLSPPPKPVRSDRLADWHLHPAKPDWSNEFDWTPGETAAHAALVGFSRGALSDYPTGRDRPAIDGTSRLSAHLHWGELSSRQAWNAAVGSGEAHRWEEAAAKFEAEIGWRDFSHQVLANQPTLPTETFNPRLKPLKWRDDSVGLEAWKKGLTGYPIVDAGMRQLWATAWMHNRVRMITASFLTKDLLVDWREGERWFWDCLVDADEANNAMNWQWVAGTGPDAQPFFRVFNPVAQGEKFDPQGDYVRRWIPELSKLDARFIHQPWSASPFELRAAGITLGDTYPEPIVDHAKARDRALAAYKAISG